MTQFKLEDLSAPEGAKPKAGVCTLMVHALEAFRLCSPSLQDRASKLVGLRLEKHMEKIRGQYQAQKAEEEERRLRYNSPHVAHKETEDTSTARSVMLSRMTRLTVLAKVNLYSFPVRAPCRHQRGHRTHLHSSCQSHSDMRNRPMALVSPHLSYHDPLRPHHTTHTHHLLNQHPHHGETL